MLGLAKGHVPSDIDLLDSEIRKIQQEIDSYLSGNPLPNDPSLIYRQSKSSSEESGVVVSIGPQDGFSAGRAPSYSGSGSSGSRSVSTFVENGGPTVVSSLFGLLLCFINMIHARVIHTSINRVKHLVYCLDRRLQFTAVIVRYTYSYNYLMITAVMLG